MNIGIFINILTRVSDTPGEGLVSEPHLAVLGHS